MNNRFFMQTALRHLTAMMFLAAICTGKAASTWNGGGADLNWGTAGNWTGGLPSSASAVIFLNNGSVADSSINNIVANNITIQTLTYGNTNSGVNQNTYINDGVTLTVSNILTTNAVFVGSGLSLVNAITSASISGAAGSLVVIATNGVFNVRQGGSANFAGRATLDLSGLSNCTIRAQKVEVAGDGTNGSAEKDRPSGTLKLAKNTTLTVSGGSYPPAIVIGHNIGNGGTGGILLLGQTNYFNCDSGMAVGMARSSACSLTWGGFPSTYARFRNTAGTDRQSRWLIGDAASVSYSGNASAGTVDFTGVQLDAKVALLVVGRSINDTKGFAYGGNSGTLSLDTGVLDVNSVIMGYQVGNYGSKVQSTLNVDSTASLIVNNAVQLGRFMSYDPSNGVSYALLNIGTISGGGTVSVNGGIITTTAVTNLNDSEIIVRNGGSLSVKGNIGPLYNFELSGSTLGLDLGAVAGTNASTPICVTTNLVTSSPITFNITGNGASTGTVTLIKYQSLSGAGADDIATLTLPPQVQGYLSNNVANSSIDLIITRGATATNVPTTPSPLLVGPIYADYANTNSAIREATARSDGYFHVDTAYLIQKLKAGNIKTYAWLVWNAYTDWDDFRLEFLPAAQAAGIKVWLYLTPPAENTTPANYTPFAEDYYSWLTETARLANQYPVLKAVALDDYYANVSLYTPAYVKKMMDAAHAINPSLMFLPVDYDLSHRPTNPTTILSPALMNDYGPYIGGVIFPYLNWTTMTNFSDESSQISNICDIVSGKLAQFVVAFPGSRASAVGDNASITQILTNSTPFPDAPYNFKFRVSDDYSGSTTGYHKLQVLVDGTVVWVGDVSGATGIQDIIVNLQAQIKGKTFATLVVRMYDAIGVSSFKVTASFNVPGGNWVRSESGAFVGTSTYYPANPAQKIPLIVMIYDGGYSPWYPTTNYLAQANYIARTAVYDGRATGIIQYCLDKSVNSPQFPIIQLLYGQWAYQPQFSKLVRQANGTITVTGNGGGPSIGFTLRASDSLSTPLASWLTISSTNKFDTNGLFTNLDATASGHASRFYKLSVP